MIAFRCPKCSKVLTVGDELAGKRAKCPVCAEHLAIPAAPKPAAVPPAPRSAAAPARGGPSPMAAPAPPRPAAGGSASGASSTGGGSLTGSMDATLPAPEAGPAVRGTVTPPRSLGDTHADRALGGSGAPPPKPGAFAPIGHDFLAPAQAADEIGRLGPYRVLKVLGAGGMGVVFMAEDPQLRRLVALKVMLPTLATGNPAAARQRFLLEARAMAALEHDHIAAIYQVGEDRGVPFMAMQFLRGESLEDRLNREGELPVAEVLRIGREIASGLAAAHARGLIHRDVKPANVWLEAGSGRVKILDFGLTRVAQDGAHLTQSGAVVGTPAYMAPEQAEGPAVDHRSDLFSLGCTLYRMCTGEAPFKGHNVVSILRCVALHHPPPPAEVNRNLPPALSQLITALLAKDPARRPPSAAAVVEALDAVARAQAGWPPQAAPAAPRARASAGSSRTPPPAPSHTAAIEPPTEICAPPSWTAPRPVATPAPAPRQPHRASPKRFWLIAGAAAGAAVLLVIVVVVLSRGGSTPQGPAVADGKGNQPSDKDKEPADLPPAPDREPLRRLEGPTRPVWGVALSPNGKLAVAASKDRTLQSWEVETGRPVRTFTGHTGDVTAVAFSPDGSQILSTSTDGTVRLWDPNTAIGTTRFNHPNGVLAGAFSPDGTEAVTAGSDRELRLWAVADGQEIRRFAGHTAAVRCVAFSRDGELVVSGSEDNTVRLWRKATGTTVHVLEGHNGIVYGVAFSPDGKRVVSGSADKTARVWDVATGKELRRFEGHRQEVNGVAFSPDGKWVLSGGDDKALRLWNATTGKQRCRFVGHTNLVFAVAISRDGRRALSGGFDNLACLWDLTDLVATKRD